MAREAIMPDATQPRAAMVGKSRVEIGRFTYGIETAEILQWGEGASLRIGAFCSIAQGLRVFLGGNHRIDWASTFPFGHIFTESLGGQEIEGHPQSKGDVVIGNDVWLGHSVTILSGVTIGDGAVIAANATVDRSVAAYEVWGGNPARFLKARFSEDVKEALLALRWWDCEVEIIRDIAPLLSKSPDLAGIAKIVDRIRAG
jgi:chloramphenicol O-acetyltransferase type B